MATGAFFAVNLHTLSVGADRIRPSVTEQSGWMKGSSRTVGADSMSRLTWFTLCAITWFTPSVEGVYQKVSSFKCVDTFVNVNPPYAEFSKNQGNLPLGTGFTHSDFFSTKSLTQEIPVPSVAEISRCGPFAFLVFLGVFPGLNLFRELTGALPKHRSRHFQIK